MADSSRMGVALLTTLQNDATLRAAMPDGVHRSVPPAGAKRFVIVSFVFGEDVPGFDGRTEELTFLVEARALSTAGGNVFAAAARIDALLEQGTLTIPGYHHMLTRRTEYIEDVEIDDSDASIRWFRCGGRYQVVASPLS